MITESKSIPQIKLNIFNFLNEFTGNNRINFLAEQEAKYGNIFAINIPRRQIIITTNPDNVKHIVVDNNKNYTKSFAYDAIRVFLGNGLLTSEGEFWKKQRRLAQPAFHKQKLNLMFQNMLQQTQKSVNILEQYADSNQSINLTKILYDLTLNIVNNTLFYNEIESTTDMIYHYVSQGNEFISDRIDNPLRLPDWLPTPVNLREKRALKSMNALFYDIINRRRTQKAQHEDLLSMYMDAIDEETGEGMSNQQLKDEILTIFVAGHETTQVALAWIFYLLSQNPDKAKILQEEIDKADIINNPMEIMHLSYLKMVIQEAMRIYPPAWIFGRKTIEEDELSGFEIGKKVNVVMPIILIHRNKNHWNNPMQFIPERFEDGKSKERHKYTYMPFGGGPRLCIGNNFALQEMQIVLALFLKYFRFDIDKTFQPEMEPMVTLRMKNALYAKVYKR
ncbi:MAG: cytochrome P450 [Chitinophagales bacterium]|nr:cytochrome P450 [Chitinophagales bacterium]